MNDYILTVRHDLGTYGVQVHARDEDSAIALVMAAEGCPRCAIQSARLEPPLAQAHSINHALQVIESCFTERD